MPILAAEPCLFPENFLVDETAVDIDRVWWAVYCRARQEKCLARQLFRRQVPFYLPLVPRQLLIRGRPHKSLIPLFTGYVFVAATDEERVTCLKTNHVSRLVNVADPRRLRFDLSQVQRLIELKVPLTVEARLAVGQRVRIRAGSMAGLEGTINERRRNTKLFVEVEFLQQAVSLEIDDYLLEPI